MNTSKPQILQKPNLALVMMPKLGKLSVVGRKLLNQLFRHARLQILEMEKAGRKMTADHLFEATLTDLTARLSKNDSDLKTLAKKYLLEMRRTEIDWEAPDARSGVVWSNMGMLSETSFEIRNGVIWALWAFPPTLFGAISDPERFTLLDLDQMAELSGYATIALFEICSRYRNNPTGVTSRKPPEWWIDALSSSPNVADKVTGLVKRREWRKIKSEFIKKAIEEINSKTDITIDLIEIRVGRTVTEVQFSVKKNKDHVVEQVLPKVHPDIAILAAKQNISLNNVARIVKSGKTDDEIRFALARMESRLNQPGLDAIENKTAYLRSLLYEAEGRLKTGAELSPAKADSQPLLVEKTWKEQRRSELHEAFLQLPKEDQKEFAERGMDLLAKADMLSATLERQFNANEWTRGLLLSKSVEAYAIANYGPDWGIEDKKVR